MNGNSEEQKFRDYVRRNIEGAGQDAGFIGLSQAWVRECIHHNYAQNFTWLGRPVIQVPQDLYATQELIWACRPDLVIETGKWGRRIDEKEAQAVMSRILTSNQKDQLSTYQTSSLKRFSQSSAFRPCICAQPVSPGTTSWRRACSGE